MDFTGSGSDSLRSVIFTKSDGDEEKLYVTVTVYPSPLAVFLPFFPPHFLLCLGEQHGMEGELTALALRPATTPTHNISLRGESAAGLHAVPPGW